MNWQPGRPSGSFRSCVASWTGSRLPLPVESDEQLHRTGKHAMMTRFGRTSQQAELVFRGDDSTQVARDCSSWSLLAVISTRLRMADLPRLQCRLEACGIIDRLSKWLLDRRLLHSHSAGPSATDSMQPLSASFVSIDCYLTPALYRKEKDRPVGQCHPWLEEGILANLGRTRSCSRSLESKGMVAFHTMDICGTAASAYLGSRKIRHVARQSLERSHSVRHTPSSFEGGVVLRHIRLAGAQRSPIRPGQSTGKGIGASKVAYRWRTPFAIGTR